MEKEARGKRERKEGMELEKVVSKRMDKLERVLQKHLLMMKEGLGE